MKSIQREKWSENRVEIGYFKILKYVFRYFDFFKAQNSYSAKIFKRKRTAINLNLKR